MVGRRGHVETGELLTAQQRSVQPTRAGAYAWGSSGGRGRPPPCISLPLRGSEAYVSLP